MKDISCLNALSRSWERMKAILFQPFSLDKWLILGFCVWLAYLFDNWGSSFNFNFGGSGVGKVDKGLKPVWKLLRKFFVDKQPVTERISESLGIPVNTLLFIIAFAAFAALAGIAIFLVTLWIKSRFEFILIDNVALNKAEVVNPWNKFKAAGNSAFLFRTVLWALSFAVFATMAVITVFLLYNWIKLCAISEKLCFPGWGAISSLIIISVLWLAAAIIFGLTNFFFKEFILVIMYRKGRRAVNACYDFFSLIKENTWLFVRYWLMKIMVVFAFGIAVILLIIFTCCLAAIPLIIPYIGTVVLLPAFIFFRLLGMEMLAAVGPDYDVFPKPEPPPMPSEQS
ncbi:MAG: hypothetical protein GY750_11550 [Lentisphaerae bacterium]|nr:hypothetical protein [Lentisphaerota bacterium]MCP4102049.1 hypothetical protein [Lentisphaerota bacterium]